jgi:mannan endo-1,4-beta-mannosidase
LSDDGYVDNSHRNPISRLGLALALALVAMTMAVPAVAQASIKLGVFNPGGPSNSESASAYMQAVGRQPEMTMWYHDFGDTIMTSEERSALRASGQIPMVTWEPNRQSLSSIAGGSYDSYVRESARTVKGFGSEVLLRFAHEMNGTWYPWHGSSSTYISAWQHLVTIFREEGVANVRWVWAPNVDNTGSMPFSSYFPGDSWVDYVGLDGYNWGATTGNQWKSLREVFAISYAKITQLSSKPVIFTETSSSEIGGDKADWIRTGFINTIPNEFPRVSGVVWFNKSQEDDWRINSSTASLEAFREVANCTVYGGTQPCGAPQQVEPDPVEVKEVQVTPTVTAPAPAPEPAPAPAPTGTVSYKLTGKGKTHIKVQRRVRRTVYARVSSTTRGGHRGRNRVKLKALLHHRRLRPGSYRIMILASNGHGSRSHPRVAHFRVRPAH